jgi:hypothetical protein
MFLNSAILLGMKPLRQALLILICVCAFVSVSSAADKKPKSKAKPAKQLATKTDVIAMVLPKPGAPVEVDKKDLKNPTLIKHYFFTIQAPKGWSIVAAGSQEGPNAVTDAMVSLTPTANTAKDPTYLSVRTVYGQELPKTTADLFAVVSRDKVKQTRYVRLNGQQWIFSQFETKRPDGSSVKQYAVRTIVGTRGFLALAGTPMADAKTTGPQLLKILNTIKINSSK